MFERMAEQQFSKQRSSQSSTYSSYVDTSGELGSKELGYGMWWVSHKTELYKIAIFLLGLITVVTWVFTLWRGFSYGWYTLSQERLIIADVKIATNFSANQQRFSPTALQVLDTIVVPGGVAKYDIVATVANTNAWYVADFDYYFQIGSNTTTLQHAVLIPGEERPVAYLGFEGDVHANVAVVISNVRWTRVSNKVVPQPAVFQANRLQFTVGDFVFTRSESNPGLLAHSISFTITNASPYSYKNPKFYVGLYVGNTLVGIAPLELQNSRSLETQKVDLRSFIPNLNVTDIKIFPLINVYDPEVYLKLGA